MTLVIESMALWQTTRKETLAGQSIGFVPTMGNLHRGHLSLCRQSMADNNVTVLSIFVNPTQFNDPTDLAKYPRTFDQDLELLNQLGVDYCLILSEAEMYADDFRYQVSEHQLANILEGPIRPGHFTGMLTIVLKLLIGVGPKRAYFGEKDYQQYLLVDGMVKSFFLDCEIVACPIIREDSMLPFSSRNARLSDKARLLADQFANCFNQKSLALTEIEKALKALDIEIDYLYEDEKRRIAAVRIEGVRLLDNYAIEGSHDGY
ncbi:MAG: pantoate--beta-alanine ligase [Gammaproteobacteria bacterium]|nr:pantoate--beta-alanine ligase [Gammaproteobacteria bacterium]